MKINWGSGIAIFYVCFMLIMIFMVIKSSQNDVHLVQENYYDKDLNYEEFRKKRNNSAVLVNPVEIEYLSKENLIQLSFPEEMLGVSGKVSLFRPSNKYLDRTFELALDNKALMLIPVDSKSMPKGLWKVKIDWESQGEQYYNEENIEI
jgi:hypothetical protein